MAFLQFRSLHAGVFVLSWIFFSNLTILFNKWLIDTAGFPYPVILTCWHMVFATGATQLLARATSLLDGRHAVVMTRQVYLRAVVPIGIMYSASMVCSTLVYLYLSVPFIQMLKAAAPAVVLFVGYLYGIEHPTLRTCLNITAIVGGVVIASAGEIHFSWPGFLYQLGGLLFESLRVVMIQSLFSSPNSDSSTDSPGLLTTHLSVNEKGEFGRYHHLPEKGTSISSDAPITLPKMDPLVGLYYYAPICAVANFIIAVLWEGRSFLSQEGGIQHLIDHVGPGILLCNAFVAFMLNVSSVLLIGKTSGLILILTGILKNILLVAFAVVIGGENVTSLQVLGYTIALVGLVVYQSHSTRKVGR